MVSSLSVICSYRETKLSYSSLAFLHIKDKKEAIQKTYKLLNKNGRFVLSIDKSQDDEMVYEARRLKTYPDNVDNIKNY